MVRRTVVIGMFVVLAQLSSGCCHLLEHWREKHAYKHGCGCATCAPCAPCGCGGVSYASPIIGAPTAPPVGEPIPFPRKMPAAASMTPDGAMMPGATMPAAAMPNAAMPGVPVPSGAMPSAVMVAH